VSEDVMKDLECHRCGTRLLLAAVDAAAGRGNVDCPVCGIDAGQPADRMLGFEAAVRSDEPVVRATAGERDERE
jgi:hypothetical protein